jgi:hypothetical protein
MTARGEADEDDDLTPTDEPRKSVCGHCRRQLTLHPNPAIAAEFEIVSISCPFCGEQVSFAERF